MSLLCRRFVLATALAAFAGGCAQDTPKASFRAPLLLGASDLEALVVLRDKLRTQGEVGGTLDVGAPLEGYLLDAQAGATIDVAALPTGRAGVMPALAVYGPRSPEGLFGVATAVALADALGPPRVSFPVNATGVYLIAVGRALERAGAYVLQTRCSGVCAPPACESALCSRFCEGGFARDARGCEACACTSRPAAATACVEGTSCGSGRVCRAGACVLSCSCRDAFAPVCGRDSRTYANRCEASCAGVEVAQAGACAAEACGAGAPCAADERCDNGRCVKVPSCASCPGTYAPVCGADGQTYGNACLLECSGVALRAPGQCLATSGGCAASCRTDADCGGRGVACASGYCQPAGCTPNRAVCGSDGVTYPSSCEIPWCRGVTVAGPGSCCRCPNEFAPVCARDGRTYANRCEAGCAGVVVASEGACAGSCLPASCALSCAYGFRRDVNGCETCACQEGPSCERDAQCPSPRQRCASGVCKETCACPDAYDPVCGTDNVTYPNACRAFCAGAYDPSQPGACPSRNLSIERQECRSNCSLGSGIVCGANGVTYDNTCALCDANVPLAHAGACEPPQCVCESKFEPVCGADGVTYGSACLAACIGAPIARVGACSVPEPDACSAFASCTLQCPNGFETDPATGCRVCACRQ
jgi:hypothetical protein